MSEPKYQIGDRLPDTDMFIRGVATLRNGNHLYLLQINDNTLVAMEEDLETNVFDGLQVTLRYDKIPF